MGYKEYESLLRAIGIDDATRERLYDFILSPVVLRFDKEKLERKKHKSDVLAKQYTAGFKSFFPYLTIDDLTDEFIMHVEEITGINLVDLRDKAMIAA